MEIHQKIASRSNRLIAYLIDIIPISLVVYGLVMVIFGSNVPTNAHSNTPSNIPFFGFLTVRSFNKFGSLFVWIIYCIIMETSEKQGTFGRVVMGIKVVNEHGGRLTIEEAVARNLTKIVSFVIFSLGFFWIFIDSKSQGWHDKVKNTYVVNV